jgi:hypothetical protein
VFIFSVSQNPHKVRKFIYELQYNFVILHHSKERNTMKDITSHNIDTFVSLIEESQSIAIVGHMKPDGDALGSCVGMYHYLGLYGKDSIKIVLPHRTQAYLNFILDEESSTNILIHEDHPKKAEEAIRSSDLIICLDFNAFHRTDRLENALTESSAAKILIDHHLNPDRDSFTLSISEIAISSEPVIKIKTGGEILTFGITTDVKVKVNGDVATLYDLRVGDAIKATTESDTILSIETTSVSGTGNPVNGIVEVVNASKGFIKVNGETIFCKDTTTTFVTAAGETKTMKNIAEGQTVSVRGVMQNGAYMATLIIIE